MLNDEINIYIYIYIYIKKYQIQSVLTFKTHYYDHKTRTTHA